VIDPQVWQQRAGAAEAAVLGRHLRRVLSLPDTSLGVVSWPAAPGHRLFLRWHLWWQAHLLDCAVDAWLRSPDDRRARTVRAMARSIWLRNLGRYTNDYYDDMAWIALALQRAVPAGVHPQSIRGPVTAILDAWSPPVGGIPWRRGDDFYNSPANAPAAILLARSGFTRRAGQLADWIDQYLRTPGSALIADGFHPGEDLKPVFFTYNQGATLGAEVELAARGADHSRVHRLVAAVATEMTSGGVLVGHGGGDPGLFTGILGRYLALVSTRLPGSTPADDTARATAAELVITSAAAAWDHRVQARHGPLFGPDWTVPARVPGRGRPCRASGRERLASAEQPERDLSVQLSGWMITEAAALLVRAD
jgi:predicted alpha-1,6-mannanase (GH76 family)